MRPKKRIANLLISASWRNLGPRKCVIVVVVVGFRIHQHFCSEWASLATQLGRHGGAKEEGKKEGSNAARLGAGLGTK